MIWLVIKLLTELQKFQEINTKIIENDNEHNKEIPKENDLSPEKKTWNYWWFKIKIMV